MMSFSNEQRDSRPRTKARRLRRVLTSIICAFLLLHLLTRWAPVPGGRGLFNLDGDVSVPSWFSYLQLAAAATVLFLVADLERRSGGRWWRHWAFMAMVVLYLSADEALSLHEQLIGPVRDMLGVDSGPLLFAWVLPASAAAVVVGALLIRFVLAQGRRFAATVLSAGALFILGAVGMEMVAGFLLALPPAPVVAVLIEVEIVLEEGLEMLAVMLLLGTAVEELLSRATLTNLSAVTRDRIIGVETPAGR